MRHSEHLACYRTTFAIIGAEQRGTSWLRTGECELPAEVGRILDGGIHALAGGWGVGMGCISGQVEPPLPESVGNAVLQPDPRGPRMVGDLHTQACFVQERLQLSSRDPRAGLTERQLISTSGPGRQQPPGRSLAEAKQEYQPVPPGHDVGAISGEIIS
jgi:hypothetical protein